MNASQEMGEMDDEEMRKVDIYTPIIKMCQVYFDPFSKHIRRNKKESPLSLLRGDRILVISLSLMTILIFSAPPTGLEKTIVILIHAK
jgi:hypothetical protein